MRPPSRVIPDPAGGSDGAVERFGDETLADGLEHHVRVEHERLAGADELAILSGGVLELDRDRFAPGRQQPARHRRMLDPDPVGLGKLALIGAGAHAVGATAVDDGHVLGTEALRLGGDVDGGHAAADHHDPAADRQGREVPRLAEIGNVGDRVGDAFDLFFRQSEGVDAGKAETEEDGVEVVAKLVDGEIAAELLADLDADTADRQDEIDLGLGEIIRLPCKRRCRTR